MQNCIIQQIPKKEKRFIVDKEVLYCDLAKKLWYSEKLKLKWKGPYQIMTILLNRSYKIINQKEYYKFP